MPDSTPSDPERLLALSYAPRAGRAAAAALFALDHTLARILRSTREPLIGQMRLTWWHQALCALDETPPPAEPVLQALAREVIPRGIAGAALAGMVDGWEVLLDSDMTDDATLERHATERGVALFGSAARVLGAPQTDPVAPAGRGWALADFARHIADPAVAARARALARPALDAAASATWSREGRTLGALAHLGRIDLDLAPGTVRRVGSPRRVARMLLHRITGR